MIESFLKKSFEKINHLWVSGNLKNGHNGPYRDNETDVRKIAHLLTLYSNIIKSEVYSDNTVYVDELIKLKDLLINNDNYKGGAYFRCRIKPGKDEVNGVIGIAWVIEGLCAYYEVFNDPSILEFLKKIIGGITFNERRALWERPTHLDTDKSGVDETFNHQLWLAYALLFYSKVSKKEVSKDVKSFFQKLNSHLNIHKDGLIRHGIKNKLGLKNNIKCVLKDFKVFVKSKKNGTSVRYKENGYHLFSVFAFARIKSLGFSYLYSKSIYKLEKALGYIVKEELFKQLISNNEAEDYYAIKPASNLQYNRYGLPYNVSGFEFVYSNKVFNLEQDKLSEKYFEKQVGIYGDNLNINDDDTKRETEDEINLLLRVYELSFCVCK